jgi:hypothetical protein
MAKRLPLRAIDDDPKGCDNNDRSRWAAIGLERFASETGQIPGLEIEDIVSDFIADLAHFCDRHNIDLQDQIRRAAGNYDAETRGRGVQFTQVS